MSRLVLNAPVIDWRSTLVANARSSKLLLAQSGARAELIKADQDACDGRQYRGKGREPFEYAGHPPIICLGTRPGSSRLLTPLGEPQKRASKTTSRCPEIHPSSLIQPGSVTHRAYPLKFGPSALRSYNK